MSDLPSSAELDALRLSLEVALRSVAFSLPFAVLIAWLLTRARFPGRMLFDAFVHLPLVLPPVAVGYVLLILFGVRGPIGGWLRGRFGIALAFPAAGVALAAAVMTVPLLVRAIRLSLENVDRGLEEAARTLGASPLDRFVSITLPLMLPGILAGAVTAFSAGLGEFGAVITFASNVPGVTRTLPLALYTAMQSPTGEALALRLALLSFALGLAGLLAAELLVRLVRRLLGPSPVRRVSLLGLAQLLERRPRQLSGGERQRVSLGRALLSQPRLLLLDEPLASIDAARREEVLPYLEALRDRFAIPMVYVSHQFDEVLRLATHLVLLDGGRMLAEGPVSELSLRPELQSIVGPDLVGAVLEGVVTRVDPEI